LLWVNNDMVGMINLFTDDSPTALAGLACGQPGNLVPWNVLDWRYEQRFPELVHQRHLPKALVCRQSIYSPPTSSYLLPVPVPLDFDDGMTFCSRLGAGIGQLASFSGRASWQLAWDTQLANKIPTIESVFWPFRRTETDPTFTTVYNLSEPGKIPWYPGQPNEGNENCVTCNRGGCINAYCTLPNYIVCSFPGQAPRLRMRGNCPDSDMDTHFYPSILAGNLIWVGLTGTYIRYEDASGLWVARVLRSEVWSTSEAPYNSFLLGTTLWKFYENRRCTASLQETRRQSLTACGLAEFNCNNGDCIEMELRCNGVPDCSDRSDEMDCNILSEPSEYNKELTPARPELKASVDLINILRMDEVNSKIRLKVRVHLEWSDSRLRFLNLRPNRVQNSLTGSEEGNIWQPQLLWDNVELTDFDLNVAPEVSVIFNESYVYYLTGLGDLFNARVFEGESNKLHWLETVR
jgi:hypothetical protein